jgi:hypothetical protein
MRSIELTVLIDDALVEQQMESYKYRQFTNLPPIFAKINSRT